MTGDKPPTLGPDRKRKSVNEPGSIQLLEEAVHLLRLASPGTLACYYLGSLPLVMGALYFWADMSRSAFAASHAAPAALGMGLLFIWMKCWHTIFTSRLSRDLQGGEIRPLTPGGILKMVAHQSVIQTTGLFLLVFTSPIVIHLAWLYGFYQSATVMGDGSVNRLRTVIRRSWEQARLWPRCNHLVLLILSLFGFFVLLNLALAVLMLPYMLKSFFGLESFLTRSGVSVLNTTFLFSITALTYLCLDPVVKAVYALRCFYGASIKSGLDLKVELAGISADIRAGVRTGIPVLVLVLLGLGVCLSLPGDAQAQSAPAVSGVSPEELDESISGVLKHRRYTWRMPREKVEVEEDDSLIGQSLSWLAEKIEAAFRTLGRWIRKILKWLDELMPEPKSVDRSGNKTGWLSIEKLLLILGLVLFGAALAVLLLRSWKKRSPVIAASPLAVMPAKIDLSDESVGAQDLPRDEWLALARRLMAQGDFRSALRALYLSTLAALADLGLISLAKYKSNLDYRRELARRTGDHHRDVITAFTENIQTFEQIWYGGYQADQTTVDRFSINQDRILSQAPAVLGAVSGR